jgi:hypothetical protein
VTTATGPHVRVLGSRFTIRSGDPAVAAELGRLLTPFADPTPGGGRARLITAPADAIAADALPLVLAEINTTALAEADLFAVHAGAVARAGRVIAMPAVSGTGKSTLTAACLRAGLDYVSDEALCLDWETGAVTPYPRPIALSGWSAEALGLPPAADDDAGTGAGAGAGETLFTAADLGAATATGPLALAHVVLLQRERCDEPAALEPLPRGEAVAEVLRRSFTSWRRPERAFALVHDVLGRVGTWRLTLGEPCAAADLLAHLLDD